jgi:hypothetical protein
MLCLLSLKSVHQVGKYILDSIWFIFLTPIIGSYQLLTDGHPSLVMDKCSDYWDGNSLQTMSETVNCSKNIHFILFNDLLFLDGEKD